MALVGATATAASVRPNELAQLTAQAGKDGAAAVMVHLAPVTLEALGKDLAGVNKTMSQLAQRLLTELGQEAWQAGKWDNGAGQLGIYVTPTGLKILQNSGNAESFTLGQTWNRRTHVNKLDGTLAELERQVLQNGVVDVVVTMNVDGLDYDHGPDGHIAFKGTSATHADFSAKASRVLQSLFITEASNKISAEQSVAQFGTAKAAFNPQVTLRVNRQGLIKLAANPDVRKLTPLGFTDARQREFANEVLDKARQHGSVRVTIAVRTPLDSGALSSSSWKASLAANQRVLDDILASANVRSQVKSMPIFGSAIGTLTIDELERLYASSDSRLLQVRMDGPPSKPALEHSTVVSNIPRLWNWLPTAPGAPSVFRGAGQNIVILDTGVQKIHPFFKNSSGVSRVVFEACFGTNDLVSVPPLFSRCIERDANGDSPPGWLNSGEPIGGATVAHGTHVAGIAAGRSLTGSNQAGVRQGVAPDANIVAVNVFSYLSPTGYSDAVGSLDADQIKALDLLATAMTPGINNPYVVNMSLGGLDSGIGVSKTGCSQSWVNQSYIAAVDRLKNLGVPIVASTGNDKQDFEINWPACITGIIKVGSVTNYSDQNNDSKPPVRSSFSSLVKPEAFPQEVILLAPGGGRPAGAPESQAESRVQSSVYDINGAASFAGDQGTSMAAPHVAGLYAIAKAVVPGWSVDQASAYIVANYTKAMTVDLGALGGGPTVFNRILIPN